MTQEYNFIREVREQPDAIRRTLEQADAPLRRMAESYAGAIDRIILAGCGDPYMMSIAGAYAFEMWAGIPADPIEAAELILYRHPVINARTLLILSSSSGRSIRVVDAVKLAAARGAKSFALVNVAPSPLAEACNVVIQTQAGPSNAYPSKTTTAGLAVLHALALHMAELSGSLPVEQVSALRKELYEDVPRRIEEALRLEDDMRALANQHLKAPMYTYIGSGPNLGTAMLNAAKMGETSQSLSRSTNLEEFSHLHGYTIMPDEPIFMISRPGDTGERSRAIAQNIRLNKGKPIAIGLEAERAAWQDHADTFIGVPDHSEMFGPLVAWIPLQMFAYYIGVGKGRNPDKPDRVGSDTIQQIIYGGMLPGYDKR
ncbi:MAG: SIS domain-containing protein [Anaerolineae bacterium]|nr:SIS domain-containing protein [Anaerolineae bacterium]